MEKITQTTSPGESVIEDSNKTRSIKFGQIAVFTLLFAFLGSSQLLLPNPYMPEMVRVAHLIETASESFIWGFIIAWYTCGFIKTRNEIQTGFNKLNLV